MTYDLMVQEHVFNYRRCAAINIKVSHLPIPLAEKELVWQLVGDETLYQFLWQELQEEIDEANNTWGRRFFVGGRSDGWLYTEPVPGFGYPPEIIEALKQLASDMLDVTLSAAHERAQKIDENEMLWGYDFRDTDRVEIYVYHDRVDLEYKGLGILASTPVSETPTEREFHAIKDDLLLVSLDKLGQRLITGEDGS